MKPAALLLTASCCLLILPQEGSAQNAKKLTEKVTSTSSDTKAEEKAEAPAAKQDAAFEAIYGKQPASSRARQQATTPPAATRQAAPNTRYPGRPATTPGYGAGYPGRQTPGAAGYGSRYPSSTQSNPRYGTQPQQNGSRYPVQARQAQPTRPAATPNSTTSTRGSSFESIYGVRAPSERAQPQQAPQSAAEVGQNNGSETSEKSKVAAEEADKAMEDRILRFQRKNAISGNPTAQYDYGMRFLKGNGVTKNPSMAKKWIKMSAEQGNSRAQKQLDKMKDIPLPEDKE